eukprot:3513993-Rhodomonas_salina.1
MRFVCLISRCACGFTCVDSLPPQTAAPDTLAVVPPSGREEGREEARQGSKGGAGEEGRRETDRQTDKDTQSDRQTQTHRQRQRQTERQQTQSERDRHRHRRTDRHRQSDSKRTPHAAPDTTRGAGGFDFAALRHRPPRSEPGPGEPEQTLHPFGASSARSLASEPHVTLALAAPAPRGPLRWYRSNGTA